MSKLSIIERNKKRMKMYNKYKAKRNKLLKIANNKKITQMSSLKQDCNYQRSRGMHLK